MKEAKSLQEIYKPEHQRILDNETKFSIEDVFDAKRKLKIEQNEADRKGITIEDLRLQKQVARQEVGKKVKEQEEWLNSIKNVDLKTFGNTCFHFMIESCKSNGSEFKTDCQKTMDMYREIIRYFYWNCNCEILDKSRFLFFDKDGEIIKIPLHLNEGIIKSNTNFLRSLEELETFNSIKKREYEENFFKKFIKKIIKKRNS